MIFLAGKPVLLAGFEERKAKEISGNIEGYSCSN